ncbi:glioma pathogenesis-related protein 1 isoform X2 [Bos javanicus]|uniref:glioma pathogenesis-related protein 1 isoform X2 n=1 Tax=Bos javanicus TaxID=9906 RepID=UPI002AA9275A|nr:glioma pathogenesis-related protein 1 isoform X2 [Bos javanicus]
MSDSLSRRVTFAVTAWMLSVVSSSSTPANTLPDIENEDFIKDCVRMHNKFRSSVTPAASDMLYMTWDPLLAQIAKAWASHCEFAHNKRLKPPYKLHPNFTSLGENLWTGSLSIFSVSSAITDWYDEVKYYDFKTRKCNKVCGHYTQVVWADSYKVGCAVHFCPRVSGFGALLNGAHFICNYGPPLRGTNGDLLREDSCHTPHLPGLLLPEPLSLWQATADLCLLRKHSKAGLLLVSLGPGMHKVLLVPPTPHQAPLVGMRFDFKCNCAPPPPPSGCGFFFAL